MAFSTVKMMLSIFLISFAFHANFAAVVQPTEDYYWRTYDGSFVPEDAFPAGRDIHGNIVYVGQTAGSAPFSTGLIPGTLHNGDPFVRVVIGPAYTDTLNRNVQILCTKSPEKFEWVPTNTNEFASLVSAKNPVQMGCENGDDFQATLLLGRITIKDGDFQLLGKVLTDKPISRMDQGRHVPGVLYYDNPDYSYLVESNEFELLVYNA